MYWGTVPQHSVLLSVHIRTVNHEGGDTDGHTHNTSSGPSWVSHPLTGPHCDKVSNKTGFFCTIILWLGMGKMIKPFLSSWRYSKCPPTAHPLLLFFSRRWLSSHHILVSRMLQYYLLMGQKFSSFVHLYHVLENKPRDLLQSECGNKVALITGI